MEAPPACETLRVLSILALLDEPTVARYWKIHNQDVYVVVLAPPKRKLNVRLVRAADIKNWLTRDWDVLMTLLREQDIVNGGMWTQYVDKFWEELSSDGDSGTTFEHLADSVETLLAHMPTKTREARKTRLVEDLCDRTDVRDDLEHSGCVWWAALSGLAVQ